MSDQSKIDTMGLTTQMTRVLEFIDECQRLRGMSPTVEEIRVYLGRKSKGSVHGVLRNLRDRGRIQWIERLPRSITIVAPGRAHHVLPPDLQAKLEHYCVVHDARPADVVADALALHFDALESPGEAAFG